MKKAKINVLSGHGNIDRYFIASPWRGSLCTPILHVIECQSLSPLAIDPPPKPCPALGNGIASNVSAVSNVFAGRDTNRKGGSADTTSGGSRALDFAVRKRYARRINRLVLGKEAAHDTIDIVGVCISKPVNSMCPFPDSLNWRIH